MLTFASISKVLMLKSASLTEILYWSHVEYSTWPEMSIFEKYGSRAFQRTFSEVHILKIRWDSFVRSLVLKLIFASFSHAFIAERALKSWFWAHFEAFWMTNFKKSNFFKVNFCLMQKVIYETRVNLLVLSKFFLLSFFSKQYWY